jgi:predicted secreted Zn-dependent protease
VTQIDQITGFLKTSSDLKPFSIRFWIPQSRGCPLDVTFTLRIKMPVWTSYPHRPEPERREWDRFYHALPEHERGHTTIIRREAQATYRRLLTATKDTINNVAKQ